MSKYDRDYLEEAKKLPGLFKEIQDIRYGRAAAKELDSDKEEIKFNKVYVVDHRFNAAGVITGILFLIIFMTSINGNYIFAKTEEEKVSIGKFEENKREIDLMETISTNISAFTKKEIISKEIDIEFETKYVETNLLPKDEQKVIQEGQVGKIEQTIIQTFENNALLNEEIINEVTKTEPVEKIIEVGTSEFLKKNKVHIGDVMYTTKEIEIYSTEEANEILGYIYPFINVTVISEDNGLAKVAVDGTEGYVKSEFITSEAVTPGVAEKCRIQRIAVNVNPEMKLNVPSGLTKEDFKKVLSGNANDVNKIFESHAEVFYNIEQKYGVNGIFIAAIGIHESDWGTSNISGQKKNLFGYGSYDSSAYESAYTFESYEYGIDMVAKVMVKYYLNQEGTEIFDDEVATGIYYNGPTVSGVNVRYATDPNWANRVYEIMVTLYEKL